MVVHPANHHGTAHSDLEEFGTGKPSHRPAGRCHGTFGAHLVAAYLNLDLLKELDLEAA